jgi:hypothetical protein
MTDEKAEPRFVCAWCRVNNREERNDGHNSYTVCAYCGSSELRWLGPLPSWIEDA